MQCATAATRYREYIAADPAAQNISHAKTYLAQAEACAKQQTSVTKPPPKQEPPPKEEPSPSPEPVTEPVHNEPRDEHADDSRGRRIAGLAIAGVGVLALGVAVYYTFDVRSLESDREAVCPDGCTWTVELDAKAKDLEVRGARSEKIAIGAYVAGGLAVAGGVALYLMSRSSGDRDVAVAPTSGGAVVVGRVRF